MDDAKKEKDKVQRNYDLQLKMKKDTLSSLNQSLRQRKEVLTDVMEGADNEEIALAKNDIILQELSLEQAKEDLEKYELIAPFDGVVRQIDFQEGDNIIADDDKFVYMVNPHVLEVSVLLDQVEIKDVQEGQKALVTFDTFSDHVFHGEVTTIYQTPQEKSGVISYEALVTLDIMEILRKISLNSNNSISPKEARNNSRSSTVKTASGMSTQEVLPMRTRSKSGSKNTVKGAKNGKFTNSSGSSVEINKDITQNNPVFSGMTASIEIVIQEQLDVILVPNLAISSNGIQKMVKVIRDGEATDVIIKTGITDGVQTEVIEGLQKGEIIVKSNYGSTTNSSNNETNKNDNPTRDFMRATRNGGGGRPH